MNQAQARRKELEDFRRELYQDHPEAEAFQRAKGRWLKFMLLYCLALQVLKAVAVGQQSGPLWALILGAVIGLGMHAIFLAAGMGPKWKLAWVLYLWGGYHLFLFCRQAVWSQAAGGLSAETVVRAWGVMFRMAPLAALADLFHLVFLVLILLTALWLTALPKSRTLAAEAEPLEEQWQKRVNTQPVNKR